MWILIDIEERDKILNGTLYLNLYAYSADYLIGHISSARHRVAGVKK